MNQHNVPRGTITLEEAQKQASPGDLTAYHPAWYSGDGKALRTEHGKHIAQWIPPTDANLLAHYWNTYNELREAVDNLCASLTTVMAHHWEEMPADDVTSRDRLIREARKLLAQTNQVQQ